MKVFLVLLVACLAGPALAEDRDFCADRPGQATPPCTVEPGKLMAEVGLVDWAHENQAMSHIDTVALGNMLLRAGLSQRAEIQLGWTAFAHRRIRDRQAAMTQRDQGVGDVTLATQLALGPVNGPAAIRTFVTLPAGSGPLGAGDWGAGVMVPLAFKLNQRVEVDLTPEIDAAVNQTGAGRHLAYGSVLGLGFALQSRLSLAVDAAIFRDDDRAGHSSRTTASASIAWMAGRNVQLDMGVVTALNANAPDLEAYFGVARRF